MEGQNPTFDDLVQELARCAADLAASDFRAAAGRGLEPGAIKRLLARIQMVTAYAQLKARPENRRRSNRSILRDVCEDSERISGRRCSTRALQSWLHWYNTPALSGLASGFSGLLDRFSDRHHNGRTRKPVNPSAASPAVSGSLMAPSDGPSVAPDTAPDVSPETSVEGSLTSP